MNSVSEFWEQLTDEQRASVDRARAFTANALQSAIATFHAENPDLDLMVSLTIDAVPRRHDLPWREKVALAKHIAEQGEEEPSHAT